MPGTEVECIDMNSKHNRCFIVCLEALSSLFDEGRFLFLGATKVHLKFMKNPFVKYKRLYLNKLPCISQVCVLPC